MTERPGAAPPPPPLVHSVHFPPSSLTPPESPSTVPPGFYEVELKKTRWVLPSYYVNLQALGEGAYGVVCTAEYAPSGEKVAIKKFTRPFQSTVHALRTHSTAEYAPSGEKVAIKKFTRPFQSTVHALRTHRELKLLRCLSHENVLEMIDVFSPDPDFTSLNNIYFVSVLFGSDLQNILKIQRLEVDHIQLLIYQVLRGLKYIHSAGIIHRDLKPSNIAVNQQCQVKILDFGLARQTDSEMTGYVATRWYRAPEIMLNWMHYTQTVDVWSVGCILAELISGHAIFPGDDHIDQLTRIMSIVGTPRSTFLQKINSEEARNYIRNLPVMGRRDLSRLFPQASPAAVDLLHRMLVLDPDERISVEDALRHEFVSEFATPEDEPISSELVTTDEEEAAALTIDHWRKVIYEEMERFKLSGKRINPENSLRRKLSAEAEDL